MDDSKGSTEKTLKNDCSAVFGNYTDHGTNYKEGKSLWGHSDRSKCTTLYVPFYAFDSINQLNKDVQWIYNLKLTKNLSIKMREDSAD